MGNRKRRGWGGGGKAKFPLWWGIGNFWNLTLGLRFVTQERSLFHKIKGYSIDVTPVSSVGQSSRNKRLLIVV